MHLPTLSLFLYLRLCIYTYIYWHVFFVGPIYKKKSPNYHDLIDVTDISIFDQIVLEYFGPLPHMEWTRIYLSWLYQTHAPSEVISCRYNHMSFAIKLQYWRTSYINIQSMITVLQITRKSSDSVPTSQILSRLSSHTWCDFCVYDRLLTISY